MLCISTLLLTFCDGGENADQGDHHSANHYGNPAAEGFDSVNSDPQAIAVADQVMEAMGGRAAWDSLRYISWNFFGARHLVWDRFTGNVRIEVGDSTVYLVNVRDLTGKIKLDGKEMVQEDSVKHYLNQARNIWINDSYWLVMPFKLKDSGVTLKYMDIEPVAEKPSHRLELTFKEVGVTPQNRYLVYVDTGTNLVNQWAFYRKRDQDTANFVLPWGDYQDYRGVLLSSDRGDRDLSDVMVFADLPETVFTSLDPINLTNYQ